MDLTFPPALCFRVMNQLLTLTGTWRKGGVRKRCCSSWMCMQTPTHVGWEGDPFMPRVPVVSGAVRRAAEPGRSSQRTWLFLSTGRGCCKQFKVNVVFQLQQPPLSFAWMLLRVKDWSLLKGVCCSSTQVFRAVWKDFWKIRAFLAENKTVTADKNISYDRKIHQLGLQFFFKSSAVPFVVAKW